MNQSPETTSSAPAPRIPSVPRVLFYDMWTKGIEKFTRVVEPGAADYRLLHFGSFRGEPAGETRIVDGIPAVEFSLFDGMSLEAIVASFQPDVVVGLNVTAVIDRAMLLTCRKLGVPTVFLQHGAWVDPDQVEEGALDMQQRLPASAYLSRVGKYGLYMKWYLAVRSGGAAALTPWRVLARHASSPVFAHQFPTAPDELWPTTALVFSEKDAEMLVDSHELPRERIRVIGNPEADAVLARRSAPLDDALRAELVRRAGLDPARPLVTMLEEGWVESHNFRGWTEDVRVARIVEVVDACERGGAQVLVRPHPATDVRALEGALASKPGASITRALSLVDAVDVGRAAIAVGTTALETALLLDKPIVAPLWFVGGDESKVRYARFGAANCAASPDDLAALVAGLVRGDRPPADPRRFVESRLGPVDGKAATRAREAVLELARAHARDAVGAASGPRRAR